MRRTLRAFIIGIALLIALTFPLSRPGRHADGLVRG